MKQMKLPNGYGSVVKLSGKRRKPWVARVTVGWDTDQSEGTVRQDRKTIGTFATKTEALNALSAYQEHPYDLNNAQMTLQELYDRWTASYFKMLKGKSSERSITSAWKYCHKLYKMPVKDLRARHIKGIMQDGYIIRERGAHKGERVEASPETKKRIKSVFNLMLDYALEYELIDRNYARTFEISDDIIRDAKRAEHSHITFADDEMQILWDNLETVKYADWILIQCYMGWRPQELAKLLRENVNLDDMTITGGMKTDAGFNRIVPIHPKIKDLVLKNYRLSEMFDNDYLFIDPYSSRGNINLTYDKYSNRFENVIQSLGLAPDHRPHDPRTTFVTMAKKAGVDEYVIKLLIGHRIDDLTERVYTKRDLEWLRSELEKIP